MSEQEQVYYNIRPHFMGGWTYDILKERKMEDAGTFGTPGLAHERMKERHPGAVYIRDYEQFVELRRQRIAQAERGE